MTAAEWDDLARLAEAATVGEWGAQHRESLDWLSQAEDDETHQPGSSVHNGDPGNPLFGTLWPHRNGKADAEFIAAANPATILRLIAEVLQLRQWKTEALPVISGLQEVGRALGLRLGVSITGEDAARAAGTLRAERDALAARLAAVEALLDNPRKLCPCVMESDLRAALNEGDNQ